jgi:hypothetical protein
MAKCANCANDALYVYQVTSTFDIKYCQYHLPRTLGKKGTTGVSLYKEPVVVPEPVVEAPKPSKKKAEPVVEVEPEVEAPVTEEPVADGDS